MSLTSYEVRIQLELDRAVEVFKKTIEDPENTIVMFDFIEWVSSSRQRTWMPGRLFIGDMSTSKTVTAKTREVFTELTRIYGYDFLSRVAREYIDRKELEKYL